MFPVTLRWEIAALLAAKAVALTALFLLFFGPATKFEPRPRDIERHLLSAEPGDQYGHR